MGQAEEGVGSIRSVLAPANSGSLLYFSPRSAGIDTRWILLSSSQMESHLFQNLLGTDVLSISVLLTSSWYMAAYAWLRCEKEEDGNCYEVLRSAKIIGRKGDHFHAENRYVRLSLIRTEDDFNNLIDRLHELVGGDSEPLEDRKDQLAEHNDPTDARCDTTMPLMRETVSTDTCPATSEEISA